jgi:hypothetical protein
LWGPRGGGVWLTRVPPLRRVKSAANVRRLAVRQPTVDFRDGQTVQHRFDQIAGSGSARCTLDLEMKGLRARRGDRLLELDEVERRLKPFGRRYVGVRAIPLDALVGTDGRASSFTRDFRPLHALSRDRLRSLEAAFADGAFPPIVTVKLGEAYFVIDGHHRAALARRGGAEMIDADVTELIARVPLPAGADMLEVVLRELERIFLEDSGLAEARPGVRVSVSRPAHYLELLENIQVHGYHLMRGRARVLENAEIAADWHDAIYTPTLAAIDRLRLGRLYRDAPPGDLFLVLHRHRRDAFPSTGCPHLAQTVVSVIGDGGRRRRLRLPGRGDRSPA